MEKSRRVQVDFGGVQGVSKEISWQIRSHRDDGASAVWYKAK